MYRFVLAVFAALLFVVVPADAGDDIQAPHVGRGTDSGLTPASEWQLFFYGSTPEQARPMDAWQNDCSHLTDFGPLSMWPESMGEWCLWIGNAIANQPYEWSNEW